MSTTAPTLAARPTRTRRQPLPPAPVYVSAPPLRWARSGPEPGTFCRDDSHWGREYIYLHQPAGHTAPFEALACGVCWPIGNNPTALPHREVRRYG